jgi:two-component system, NtrC family, response regulator HydG
MIARRFNMMGVEMKAKDLDLRELLQFSPTGGLLTFVGQRALILDAVALGILRKELVQMLGLSGARGVLTRFGFAHGWRTAESLHDEFPWDDETEWRTAGGRLHTLQGLVLVEAAPRDLSQGAAPIADSVWRDSYEAEQHLLHLGQADEPVCWTLTGFASGYLSRCHGREIYCIETRCCGKGDAHCRVVGHDRETWGAAIEPHLPYFQSACLDASLAQVTTELKRIERRLRMRRREMGRAAAAQDESGMVGRSAAMERVLDMARRVAKVDTTLLVTGESGVGKERVAHLVHAESARASGPFVAINCGAVAEGLLESELFGHAKGSFTGASQDRPGLFEAANGGTLLLDEIGEVPPPMQVKLLRALQEREVRRVGENRDRRVDVRVIAATNRDLLADVHSGRFRQDLYYRLRVVEIRVPPLRERRDDVLPLARAFLAAAAERSGRKLSGFTPEAAGQLVRYDWPGNVRELENAIEHAVVFARGARVDADALPEEVRNALPGAFAAGEVRPLEQVEREYIMAVVRASDGNRARAAKQLGIGSATLYRKLKLYERKGARS